MLSHVLLECFLHDNPGAPTCQFSGLRGPRHEPPLSLSPGDSHPSTFSPPPSVQPTPLPATPLHPNQTLPSSSWHSVGHPNTANNPVSTEKSALWQQIDISTCRGGSGGGGKITGGSRIRKVALAPDSEVTSVQPTTVCGHRPVRAIKILQYFRINSNNCNKKMWLWHNLKSFYMNIEQMLICKSDLYRIKNIEAASQQRP